MHTQYSHEYCSIMSSHIIMVCDIHGMGLTVVNIGRRINIILISSAVN